MIDHSLWRVAAEFHDFVNVLGENGAPSCAAPASAPDTPIENDLAMYGPNLRYRDR
jgi:hypothetical protein